MLLLLPKGTSVWQHIANSLSAQRPSNGKLELQHFMHAHCGSQPSKVAPEAATSPMEATTGIRLATWRIACHMMSEASASPPGLLMRRMRALHSLSLATSLSCLSTCQIRWGSGYSRAAQGEALQGSLLVLRMLSEQAEVQ